jgi:putative protease
MALDSYFSGKYEYNPKWFSELESVSHREYNTGYYFADSKKEANLCKNNGYIKDKAYLATVVSYDNETGVATLTQRNKMSMGDKIELLTPGKVGEEIKEYTLFDGEMNEIDSTPHPYMTFKMKSTLPLSEGDIIRAG